MNTLGTIFMKSWKKLNYYRQKPSFNEIKASQSSWFQGSNYIQFKTHVVPTLKKTPTFTITLAGANDATHETSRQILDSLLELQHEIMKTLPDCNVIFSKPKLHVEFVDNSNICVEHIHKQPPRGVLNKRCSQNMQQIYTLRHGCSPVDFLHIFRTPFSQNTSGWLLPHIGQKGFHLNKEGKDKFSRKFLQRNIETLIISGTLN